MITNDGKIHIKRYLGLMVPSIAQSIAFGIGASAESASDTRLQFEVGRSDIVITSYDFTTNKLIFKAQVPDDIAGKYYEAALFSLPASFSTQSMLISSFDSETETWLTNSAAPVYTTTNARIGINSLNHTPALSTTSTSALAGILMDLSNYSAADTFTLAFTNNNANANAVGFRFKTDASNYYTFSIATPATGMVFSSVTKGSATVTGTPDWSRITSIEVFTTAKASGAASVDFEGLRIEDTDTINQDYVMVSREVITPFTKQNGMTQEVEFSLDVAV